jgi:hypothetical protein
MNQLTEMKLRMVLEKDCVYAKVIAVMMHKLKTMSMIITEADIAAAKADGHLMAISGHEAEVTFRLLTEAEATEFARIAEEKMKLSLEPVQGHA